MMAPVKEPFSCPNNSDSIKLSGTAPQSNTMIGPDARVDRSWMVCATTSLPVPVSPSMTTVVAVGAILAPVLPLRAPDDPDFFVDKNSGIGTSGHLLGTDESGYDNLFFAGDWTRCGLNSGCVEAAVISGLLAAAAVDRTRATHPRRSVIGCRDNQGARYVF